MIDLTKPIRRKKDGRTFMQAAVAHFHTLYPYPTSRVEDGIRATPDELERDYENIPETRKPEVFWINSSTMVAYLPCPGGRQPPPNHMRVIQWPRDAPLPDWPEGYP